MAPSLVATHSVVIPDDGLRPTATAQSTGSIRGRVLNVATGQYLNNARVTLKGTDHTVFTSRDGSYILVNGPVVKDGETMGLTAEQRIKVRHVRSFRPDVNENVYWLELADNPAVERPKGFFSSMFGSGSK